MTHGEAWVVLLGSWLQANVHIDLLIRCALAALLRKACNQFYINNVQCKAKTFTTIRKEKQKYILHYH